MHLSHSRGRLFLLHNVISGPYIIIDATGLFYSVVDNTTFLSNQYHGIDVQNDSQNGTIQLVPIANPTPPPGGIVVSSANVKSEPVNQPPTSVHIQPSVQYIQSHDGVPVSSSYMFSFINVNSGPSNRARPN